MNAHGILRLSGLVAGIAVVLFAGLPPFLALALGSIVASFVSAPNWSSRASKQLLAASIVALGFGVDFAAIWEAARQGLLVAPLTLALTFGIGMFLARRLGLGRDLSLMITAGTAICGGSAIAAVAPVLRARSVDIGTALGVVFSFNAAALVIFPWLGPALGLEANEFGLWCALAIHDTSSVVAAAATQGQEALEFATVTKMARALWITPVAFGIFFLLPRETREEGAPRHAALPWFLVGFLVAAAAVAWIPELRPLGDLIAGEARRGMNLALFFAGLGLAPKSLKAIGLRPFLFGFALWLALGFAAYVVVVATR